METAEPWDVGIEAEFRMEVGGQEFYGLALTVTSHPGVGMGLHFKQVYPQYLPALEALLATFGSTEASTTNS